LIISTEYFLVTTAAKAGKIPSVTINTRGNMSEDKDLLDRIAKISGTISFWPELNLIANFL